MERHLIECGRNRAIVFLSLLSGQLSDDLKAAVIAGDQFEEVGKFLSNVLLSVWKETLLSLAIPYFIASNWHTQCHVIGPDKDVFPKPAEQKEEFNTSVRMLYLLNDRSQRGAFPTFGLSASEKMSSIASITEHITVDCPTGTVIALPSISKCWVGKRGSGTKHADLVVLDVVAACTR
jgi:hypothetical protein